jgi:thiamine monophosphate synthase
MRGRISQSIFSPPPSFACVPRVAIGGVDVERVDGAVFTFAHGKVVRLDYYNDKQQALQAVGLQE